MAIKGYWKLNGNSNDYSGNGNNGTDTNITYSKSNGRLNQGAGFNGSSSRISITNVASLRPQNTLTISAWVKVTPLSTVSYIFQSSYEYQGTPWNFAGVGLFIDLVSSNYSIVFQTGNYSASKFSLKYIISQNLINSKWNLITATLDGTTGRLYLNGFLIESATDDYLPSYQANNYISIGGRNVNGTFYNYFNGCIDELIIDNTAWSPAQIKNYYAATKGFF